MGSFKNYLKEEQLDSIVEKIESFGHTQLFEYEPYKNIAGTNVSYRIDNGDVNKNTIKHAHVYAKAHGKGKELYSVDVKGKGHDGYSGYEISKKHADFFRDKGFYIPSDNILEVINIDSLDQIEDELFILNDGSLTRQILQSING